MSLDYIEYLSALKNTELIDLPAEGFSKAAGLSGAFKTIIHQNNTILELQITTLRRLDAIEARIRSLEAQKGVIPDDLITKFQNLAIEKKPVQTKGLLRIREDPKKALAEEIRRWELRK